MTQSIHRKLLLHSSIFLIFYKQVHHSRRDISDCTCICVFVNSVKVSWNLRNGAARAREGAAYNRTGAPKFNLGFIDKAHQTDTVNSEKPCYLPYSQVSCQIMFLNNVTSCLVAVQETSITYLRILLA